MRKYIFIPIGGLVGAVLRYAIKNIQLLDYDVNFPYNTLFVNVTGSFCLMIILTAIAFRVLNLDEGVRLGIATGFLGAYTTFSTLCKETINFVDKGYYFSAIFYIMISTLSGLGATYFAFILLRTFRNCKQQVLVVEQKDEVK